MQPSEAEARAVKKQKRKAAVEFAVSSFEQPRKIDVKNFRQLRSHLELLEVASIFLAICYRKSSLSSVNCYRLPDP